MLLKNYRDWQRCFCLWGFISDFFKSMPGRSQARRLKGRKKFQTCGSRKWHPSVRPRRTYNLLFICRGHAQGHFPVEGAV